MGCVAAAQGGREGHGAGMAGVGGPWAPMRGRGAVHCIVDVVLEAIWKLVGRELMLELGNSCTVDLGVCYTMNAWSVLTPNGHVKPNQMCWIMLKGILSTM